MAKTHSHLHDFSRQAAKRLLLSLGITILFVAMEVIYGLLSNSLALITDAVHNVTDAMTLSLTFWAMRKMTHPADSRKTFGYQRAGILVALVNSISLVLIAFGIFYEAGKRLLAPPEVEAGTLIWVGLAAVTVNLVTALLVRHGSEHDLTLKSAFLHLMGDVLSTAGAVAAGLIILFTGANWVDPLVSVFIGLLILWNAWGIVRESVQILMESTPADIDMEGMIRDIEAIPGVRGVHDLHVWSISQSMRTLTAHIVSEDMPLSQGAGIRSAISRMLVEKYKIPHATLQVECPGCVSDDIFCSHC